MNTISAVEKGHKNKERYVSYVNDLEREGKKFPINQYGDVNLSQIAAICGFNRQVFSTNKSMKQQLMDDVKRIGTDITEAEKPDDMLARKAKFSAEQVNKLRRDLMLAEEKIEALQQQVIKLERENRILQNEQSESNESLSHLLETGRRFSL